MMNLLLPLLGRVKVATDAIKNHLLEVGGGGNNPHGSQITPTANTLMKRDGNGRSQVAAGVAPNDIAVVSQLSVGGGGTVTAITAGAGLASSGANPITTSATLSIADVLATTGSYAYPTITVNLKGQITAIAAGTPVTSITASSPLFRNVATGAVTLSIFAADAATDGYLSAANYRQLFARAAMRGGSVAQSTTFGTAVLLVGTNNETAFQLSGTPGTGRITNVSGASLVVHVLATGRVTNTEVGATLGFSVSARINGTLTGNIQPFATNILANTESESWTLSGVVALANNSYIDIVVNTTAASGGSSPYSFSTELSSFLVRAIG